MSHIEMFKWNSISERIRADLESAKPKRDSLEKISVPALILKADASDEERKAHQQAASVMQHGKLVHIDNAGHNLHHDQLNRTCEVLSQFLSTLYE